MRIPIIRVGAVQRLVPFSLFHIYHDFHVFYLRSLLYEGCTGNVSCWYEADGANVRACLFVSWHLYSKSVCVHSCFCS
jgi:hypothetical protein